MKAFSSSRQRRPHSTPEQRAKWVEGYERSGLSQREFAQRHRLGVFTLRHWIAQKAKGAASRADARPVWRELKLDGLSGATRWAAEVVRPDGYVVRVAHDAPSALLEELLRARPC